MQRKQRGGAALICLGAALLMLVFAISGYAEDTDKTRLQAAINEFAALDENVYTPATYRLAQMERDKGQALIGDLNATQAAIDSATDALNRALAALRIRNGSESLWRTYQDYFMMGNIFDNASDLAPNNSRGILTTTHFNILTCQNCMKPDALSYGSGATGVFRISPTSNHTSDQLAAGAINTGKKVHGHVLVWHSQTPNWINGGTGGNYTRAQARANMELYIKTVVEHFDTRYPGVVISWDVVNEAFVDGVGTISEGADWKDYLRPASQSAWIKSYSNGMSGGEHPSDFIYDAFVFARKYTTAKLFYNDFNMYQDGKSKLVALMVKELNARYRNEHPDDPRQLIDGVGDQSHNYIIDTPPSRVENGIRNLLSAGVDIAITELDLFCWFPWNAQPAGGYRDLRDRTQPAHITGSTGTDEQKYYWINRGFTNGSQIEVVQAEVYAEYFRVFKNYAAHIDRVTFWGLTDRQSWRSGHNPLLWNQDYSPKDAFFAVSDPEGYLGVEPRYVKAIAAPEVAEIILRYNGIQPIYKRGPVPVNLISEVARFMGPRTDFNGVPKSISVDGVAVSNPQYRKAVFAFLKAHPGLSGKIVIMPPDTFFIDNVH